MQQFLTPTVSSYVRQTSDHKQDMYILDCQLVGAMALAFIAITPTSFLFVVAAGGVNSIIALSTLVCNYFQCMNRKKYGSVIVTALHNVLRDSV